jgi:DHA1 family bicyclomycin/chloramphenicol resistance-like MFS transporter
MFATDMYTPALPVLAKQLATSDSLANLTLMVFFIFSMVGMVLFGPISDRVGRKPVLHLGCLLFTLASLGCAFAPNIVILIVARLFQALAAGMIAVVGTALVRDCFDGKMRENVLLWIQAAFVLGPIIAPLIGGQVLIFFSWRATFVILAILGVFGMLMTLFFQESLLPEQRMSGTLLHSFIGLARVTRRKPFMLFMLSATVFTALPFLAYLMTAPYVYENFFGFTPQGYSYFFGATAGLSVLGILFYKLISRRMSPRRLTTLLITLSAVDGLGIILFGALSPFVFFALILVFYIAVTMVRPYSMNILLGMCSEDVGSASSVMNFCYSILGIMGSAIALPFTRGYIELVGALVVVGALASASLWIYLLRSKIIVKGIKE